MTTHRPVASTRPVTPTENVHFPTARAVRGALPAYIHTKPKRDMGVNRYEQLVDLDFLGNGVKVAVRPNIGRPIYPRIFSLPFFPSTIDEA